MVTAHARGCPTPGACPRTGCAPIIGEAIHGLNLRGVLGRLVQRCQTIWRASPAGRSNPAHGARQARAPGSPYIRRLAPASNRGTGLFGCGATRDRATGTTTRPPADTRRSETKMKTKLTFLFLFVLGAVPALAQTNAVVTAKVMETHAAVAQSAAEAAAKSAQVKADQAAAEAEAKAAPYGRTWYLWPMEPGAAYDAALAEAKDDTDMAERMIAQAAAHLTDAAGARARAAAPQPTKAFLGLMTVSAEEMAVAHAKDAAAAAGKAVVASRLAREYAEDALAQLRLARRAGAGISAGLVEADAAAVRAHERATKLPK